MNEDLLRKKYPVGTRVKYTGKVPIYDCSVTVVAPGDLGTVHDIVTSEHIRVKWDNGKTVTITHGETPFAVVYGK